jgi:2-oxoacid:acceptor oxidoreductase delta subunit (pyruvate/2-ketoisovalerate family)
VTIFEGGPSAGGMMRFGIPKYRLPREIMDAEIARIEAMGVRIVLNHKVESLAGEMRAGSFDAAFLAVGAHLAKRAYVPACDASRVLEAITVLHDVETGEAPQLGRRVVVYGGGNTAIDAARTARRLGATDTLVIYRRTRETMPAHEFEVQEAVEEGIQFRWLSTIKEAGEGFVTVEKMKLDDTGMPQPTGEFETVSADAVVLALGQESDLGLLHDMDGVRVVDGVVEVTPQMMTGHDGVFAGGDMVPSERTITVAVGHGKKAARNIDAYLRATTYTPREKHEVASFAKLNAWYYTDAPKSVQPTLELARRQTSFGEVVGGLDEEHALFEARRCLSCGNCFECDNCYGICPDNAVIKLGWNQRYRFDYDYCKGCGICATECPCGAIEMVGESV